MPRKPNPTADCGLEDVLIEEGDLPEWAASLRAPGEAVGLLNAALAMPFASDQEGTGGAFLRELAATGARAASHREAGRRLVFLHPGYLTATHVGTRWIRVLFGPEIARYELAGGSSGEAAVRAFDAALRRQPPWLRRAGRPRSNSALWSLLQRERMLRPDEPEEALVDRLAPQLKLSPQTLGRALRRARDRVKGALEAAGLPEAYSGARDDPTICRCVRARSGAPETEHTVGPDAPPHRHCQECGIAAPYLSPFILFRREAGRWLCAGCRGERIPGTDQG